MRLAGHRGHEEPGPLPGDARQGALRRRCGGSGRGAIVDGRQGRGRRRRRRLRGAAGGHRPRGRRCPTGSSSTRTSAPTLAYTWELKPDEAKVDAAFAAAAHVVKERYIQQRLIPSAMEPRGVLRGTGAVRRGLHRLLRHPDPPHPQGHAGAQPRHLGARSCGSSRLPSAAASGRSSTSTPRRLLCVALARSGSRSRCAGPRSARENAQATIQGRGQIQDIELAADADGKVTAVRVNLAGRHGCLPAAGDARASRCSGRSSTTASTTCRRTRSPARSVFTTMTPTDAYRGAGPAGGDLRHRTGDGRPRPQGRRRPGRDPAAQLHPDRRRSRTPRRRA